MRLLLAEDEKDLSDALVTVLKHNNYSVDAVYNGQDALDYLTEGDNYDGAILDIMMPKPPMPSFPLAMSGWTYQLSTDTGTLRLANKEYQMLEMLMTNP